MTRFLLTKGLHAYLTLNDETSGSKTGGQCYDHYIHVFVNFRQFLAKMAFSEKNNVMIHFC
jgi:hypothetical protein